MQESPAGPFAGRDGSASGPRGGRCPYARGMAQERDTPPGYDWEDAAIWDVPGLREKDLRDQAGSVFVGKAHV